MRQTAWISRTLLALLLTGLALAHVWGWLRIPALTRLDALIYDSRLRSHQAGVMSEPIVIVNVDEASLSELGRWPWPRSLLADVVDRLFDDYGIRALGFDFLLPDAGNLDALHVLDELVADSRFEEQGLKNALTTRRAQWDHNGKLAKALRNRNVVLGFVFKDFVPEGEPAGNGALPEPLALPRVALPYIEATGHTGILEHLLQPGVTAGFVSNPSIDEDGVVRRAPLLMAYDGKLYPSFSLALARAALGSSTLDLRFAGDEARPSPRYFEGLELGARLVPLDERLNALIPYRGRTGSFPYLSFVDVLHGRAPFDALFDKVVLIGTTAAGLPDLHTSPVGPRFAGVEIHANLLQGLLEGRIHASPLYLRGLESLMLIALAILVTLLSGLPLTAGTLGMAGLGLVLHWASVTAWTDLRLDLPLASSTVLAATLFAIQFLIVSARQVVQRNALVRVFGQYVPRDVARELNRDSGSLSLDGESRDMSVLFSDVRGFTAIAEGLQPQELTRLMNAFLSPITEVIHRHRGTIDKYMGDAVMAFWGAPLQDTRHAHHAVSAGLKMIRALEALQPQFQARGWPELKIGIGINTGKMHVGNMGSTFRVAYTVLGDAVNLGSRLEGLTKNYGVQLIVSETTATQAQAFSYRELDMVRVKGKAEPVRIYEPIASSQSLSNLERESLDSWHAALTAYRAQDWTTARRRLESLHEAEPDRTLYAIYLQRIDQFEERPPPQDWDGVFVHTSK